MEYGLVKRSRAAETSLDLKMTIPVFYTVNGTPYLRSPGVSLIAKPQFLSSGLFDFTNSFPDILDFHNYQFDSRLPPAEDLCKFAGQLCYMSLGPKRTTNENASKYFNHIKESGHGSVLEHANFSFLFYGVSRSLTHELVRHRAGFAFSQVSQRYVSGKTLRFVERPEYQDDEVMHDAFEDRIDDVARAYNIVAEALLMRQPQDGISKTDLRKKVNQCARSILPNETEAPIVVTANVRAWRHFLEARGNSGAEVEIRLLALKVLEVLKEHAPILFSDYEVTNGAISSNYRKV